jgi:hypothetical protein
LIIVKTILCGLAGGFLVELNVWWKLRYTPPEKLPQFYKYPHYWVTTIAMIAAGGGLALVYVLSGISVSPLLAVNVGASAPLIIGNLTAKPATILE